MSLANNKLVNYILSSKEELKKVTWPTKRETMKYTFIVIGMSVAVGLFLGALDYGFTRGLALIIK
jgi:preprotein translocase subunit SecE